jgi:hypothetical protein
MAERPRTADDVLDNTLLDKMLSRITELGESAKQAANIDDREDLIDDAGRSCLALRRSLVTVVGVRNIIRGRGGELC